MLKQGEPSIIINITLFFDLLAWAKAIKILKDSGDGSALSTLINKKLMTKYYRIVFGISLMH